MFIFVCVYCRAVAKGAVTDEPGLSHEVIAELVGEAEAAQSTLSVRSEFCDFFSRQRTTEYVEFVSPRRVLKMFVDLGNSQGRLSGNPVLCRSLVPRKN